MSETHVHDPARCRQLLGQLNDYVDGALAAELCQDLEEHMAACPNCRVVFDTLSQTIVLYRALDHAPVELPADVEARLLSRLSFTAHRSSVDDPG